MHMQVFHTLCCTQQVPQLRQWAAGDFTDDTISEVKDMSLHCARFVLDTRIRLLRCAVEEFTVDLVYFGLQTTWFLWYVWCVYTFSFVMHLSHSLSLVMVLQACHFAYHHTYKSFSISTCIFCHNDHTNMHFKQGVLLGWWLCSSVHKKKAALSSLQ